MTQQANHDLSSVHPLEIRTLRVFSGRETAVYADAEMLDATHLEPAQQRRAIQWLLSKGLIETVAERQLSTVLLTEVGAEYAERGTTPESALLARAGKPPFPSLKDLQKDTRFEKRDWGSAFGALKKGGVIRQDGEAIQIADEEKAAFYRDRLMPELFERLQKTGDGVDIRAFSEDARAYIAAHARKRGKASGALRVEARVERSYRLTQTGGRTLAALLEANLTGEEVSRLRPEMLKDGAWRHLSFRRYDLSIRPPRILVGRAHAYRAYLDNVRRNLLSLGFEEMKGPLVETEFWNMDALFMPQFHAARNIHDAYYVKHPERSKRREEPYFTEVGETHANGGKTGSRGWRYPFDPDRSRRLILRTQGTALSARTLASSPNIPGKYFAIVRCFRPDDVDATHAADFIQVEGIVLGAKINFRGLLGLLNLFALELAQAEEVRYVPDYFPFTEPSVELQAKHPSLGWVELGGAGLFRPEVTQPLGVDVPVIAWGLGVDRMAMVALGINDIRDLFSTDLDFVRNER